MFAYGVTRASIYPLWDYYYEGDGTRVLGGRVLRHPCCPPCLFSGPMMQYRLFFDSDIYYSIEMIEIPPYLLVGW